MQNKKPKDCFDTVFWYGGYVVSHYTRSISVEATLYFKYADTTLHFNKTGYPVNINSSAMLNFAPSSTKISIPVSGVINGRSFELRIKGFKERAERYQAMLEYNDKRNKPV